MNITHPWVIIHQKNGNGKMETILAGPDGATSKEFALCAADLIRHIAKATGEKESKILSIVKKEIDNPTTDIKQVFDS